MRWFICSCGNQFSEDAQNWSEYKAGQCPVCGSDDINEVLYLEDGFIDDFGAKVLEELDNDKILVQWLQNGKEEIVERSMFL